MNALVSRFGKMVGDNIGSHPERALSLLKTGYAASGLYMKYFLDRRLLPHQKYAAVISSRAIRAPLALPHDSAVVSVFLPCEMLHAAGIIPQFIEGLACYINGAASETAFIRYAENLGIPQTYCSYHKVLLGAALSGVLPRPRFIVNTTLACDANNSTFRMLADYWKVPHFIVDVPFKYNADTVGYVARQFRNMADFLRDVGVKFDADSLKSVIRRENRSVRLYREFFRELSDKFLSNTLTSEMYKIFLTHVLLGTEEAERYFRILLEDVKKAKPAGNEIRILWAHSLPFWQDCVRDVFDYSTKVQLLCSDMNFDSDMELDEDHPYESMAQKLLCNTMGGGGNRRADKLLNMAKSLRADGVVYFCSWGCKQTLGGAQLAKEGLEKAGIPTLILDGDGCDRENVGDGQTATRLQAFMELLEAKK